ncbi:hypothetical protein [Brevibacterium picturae]|uniref:LPXTG-motif cell wall anchor domain-containing protein n=1 Tax=Brevibacterium picturae TaxID=260553 RepID=A0ABN2BDA6_9MICO
MKRLALAASIALAVSTIGVGPAVANSLDPPPELTTQENAQSPGAEAENVTDAVDPGENGSPADQGGDDAQGDAGQGQNGGHDGVETADPGAPTSPGEDTADSDGDKDDATEDASDDGSDGAEESEPIEADFSLEKTTMTAEEIGDPETGIRYTIDSLKTGDVVTAEPGEDSSTTVEEDGTFSGAIMGNSELKTGDTLDVTVTVEREGQESKTFSGSVEVVAADDEDEDEEPPSAELTVSPQSQGLHEFLTDGVSLMLVNCVVDEEVTFRISTQTDPDTTVWEDTQMAGEDAAGASTFVPDGEGGADWVGDYLVTASCGDQSVETTFTVTADDSAVDPKLAIDPETVSGKDFVNRDKGVTMTVTACEPGSDVQFKVWGHESSEKLYDRTVEANENGAASVQVYGLENNPDAYAGTYKVIAVCMDQSMEGQFVVTGGGAGDPDGGSDDSGEAGNSGNAGSMPRTGAELTGLGAGAVLILAGAATIISARRRAQFGS